MLQAQFRMVVAGLCMVWYSRSCLSVVGLLAQVMVRGTVHYSTVAVAGAGAVPYVYVVVVEIGR